MSFSRAPGKKRALTQRDDGLPFGGWPQQQYDDHVPPPCRFVLLGDDDAADEHAICCMLVLSATSTKPKKWLLGLKYPNFYKNLVRMVKWVALSPGARSAVLVAKTLRTHHFGIASTFESISPSLVF